MAEFIHKEFKSVLNRKKNTLIAGFGIATRSIPIMVVCLVVSTVMPAVPVIICRKILKTGSSLKRLLVKCWIRGLPGPGSF